MSRPLCYTRRMIKTNMKNENIYRVTLVDGPTTAITPIKARDFQHATRIASRMGLGVVCAVEFAREDS